jgi:hypothetical protein
VQDEIPQMPDLRASRKRLGRLLRRGQLLLDSAEVRCQAAKPGNSKRKLRAVGRRLRAAQRVVRGGYGRSVPSPGEAALLAGTTLLRDDTRTLMRDLACP